MSTTPRPVLFPVRRPARSRRPRPASAARLLLAALLLPGAGPATAGEARPVAQDQGGREPRRERAAVPRRAKPATICASGW